VTHGVLITAIEKELTVVVSRTDVRNQSTYYECLSDFVYEPPLAATLPTHTSFCLMLN